MIAPRINTALAVTVWQHPARAIDQRPHGVVSGRVRVSYCTMVFAPRQANYWEYGMPEEVNIKVTSHPLRLAYLVNSREDITNALTLYTHTWGGIANYMFPLPQNERDVAALQQAFSQTDPDVVFIPEGELSQKLVEVLDQAPFVYRSVQPPEIHEHANGPNLLHIYGGNLSHAGVILQRLHKLPLPESHVRIVMPNDAFGFALMLHAGNPTDQYRKFLVDRLAAQVLPTPSTFLDFVKTSFVLSSRSNPLIVSAEQARWTWSGFEVAMDTDPGIDYRTESLC